MSSLLLTGASGFIGQSLLPELLRRGHKVYGLYRKQPEGYPPSWAIPRLISLHGDITQSNLGLEEVPRDIDAVYHLAGITNLSSEDRNDLIWKTNVLGTQNVVSFCAKHNIPSLFFCSTAYTIGEGRNPYERSKIACEKMVAEADIPKKVIFKPSVILGTNYSGHLSEFVSALIRFHHRAELVRRRFENKLQLPPLRMLFRVRGNENGKLNLVQVNEVIKAMARIDSPGIYWLTHPSPPRLNELASWVSDIVMLDFKIVEDFKPNLLEARFMNWIRAFTPYLEGDSFKSDLKDCPPIDRALIEQVIRNTLV